MQILTTLSLAITIALQICIAALLLRRKLQKRFLWFFLYILYELFECALRLAVSGNQRTYFMVYWSTAVPGILLTVLALRESFLSIFLPETRLRWFRWVFWCCIGLAATYAGWEVWASPPRQASMFMAAVLDLEFSIGTVISIFGLLYAGSIRLFYVLDHQRATAIILGFTVNASIAIFSWITRSAFGTKYRMLSEFIPAAAYIVAEAIWTRDLLRQERKIPELKQTLEEMSETIDRYTAIMNRYMGRERWS